MTSASPIVIGWARRVRAGWNGVVTVVAAKKPSTVAHAVLLPKTLPFPYWHDAGIWARTLATVSSSVLHDTMYGSRELAASDAQVSALKVQRAPALMALQHSFALAHTAQSVTSSLPEPASGRDTAPAPPPFASPAPGCDAPPVPATAPPSWRGVKR